jgi:hypothetical protein
MSQDITWEDVLNTALGERDSMEGFTPPQQELILSEATARVPSVRFGAMTFHARRYLAAHMAAMMTQVSAGQGTIASTSIGGISTSSTMPVNNPTAEQNLLSTVYGRQYYEIRKSKVRGFYVG